MIASATFHPIAQFSQAEWVALEAMRRKTAQAIDWPVNLEAGATDDGQTWAALAVDSLPPGAFGQPDALATILRDDDGQEFTVTAGFDGDALATARELGDVLEVAQTAAVRQFNEVC